MPVKRDPIPKKSPAKAYPEKKIVPMPEPHLSGMRARVWASCGLTINRGDYNSARVDAGMSMDVPDGTTVEETFAMCWEQAEREIGRQVNAIRETFPAD